VYNKIFIRFVLSITVITIPFISYANSNYETLKNKKNFSLFNDALESMTGYYVYCPPIDPVAYILEERIPKTLDKIIYKPWEKTLYPNRYKKIDTIKALIKQWGYRSIYNYKVFKQYQASKDGALKDLQDYYIKEFNFDIKTAKKYALYSFDDILSSHFNINKYSIEVRKYDKLREYLLTNRSIEKIEPLLVGNWQYPKELSYDNEDTEPMLFYALYYPKLLEYLICKGVNINDTNSFGKTALMYTAQYNLYESANLLIKYNIDINKATFHLEDSCENIITTHKVTALHYAVRYADFKFIKLLLDNGANKNLKDSDEHTPFDYIKIYSKENKNLTKNNIEKLKLLLKPISNEEYKKRAKQNYKKALKYFKIKEYEKSAYFYEQCLEYDHNYTQAMSDLCVVYFKLGKLEKAKKIAQECISNKNVSANQEASSLYNIGLICLNKGKIDCRDSSLEYFIKAYKVKPSNARAKQILKNISLKYAKKFPTNSRYITIKDNKLKMLGIYGTVYLLSKNELDDSVIIYSQLAPDTFSSSFFYEKILLKYKNRKYYLYLFATDAPWPNQHTKICFDKEQKQCSSLVIYKNSKSIK